MWIFFLVRSIAGKDFLKYKIPILFFIKAEKNTKIHVEPPTTPDTKTIFSKRNNAEEIAIPNLKIYFRAIVIKTVSYRPRNKSCRPMKQKWKTQP